MRRTLPRAALLACLLAALTAAPAAAAPAWLAPTDLSAPLRDASNPDIAMDAGGDLIAVWARKDANNTNFDLQASVRPAGGDFSAPLTLSDRATQPQVAMTPGGDAVVVWKHFDVATGDNLIQASTRPAGGSFSSPVDVALLPSNATPDMHLAINANGDAAVVWTQDDESGAPKHSVVAVSTRSAGGVFSAPRILSPSGHRGNAPDVAVGPGGEATVVWQDQDATADANDPTNPIKVVESHGSGATFSAPADRSSAADDFGGAPSVAVDAAGDAVVVWHGYHVTDPGDPENQIPPQLSDPIVYASIRSGGSFSAPAPLSAAPSSSPQVAMNAAGEAVAVWTHSDGANRIIQASSRPPGGAFPGPSGAVDLSADGQNSDNPQVVVNEAGGATAIWSRELGAGVQATVRPAGGAFPPPPIGDISPPPGASNPRVAMDDAGNAAAIWVRDTGGSGDCSSSSADCIAQVAGYDAVGPVIRGLSVPPTATAGEPVSFSVDPFDVWPLTTTFSFGDGASAQGTGVSHTYAARGTYQVTVTTSDGTGAAASAGGTISVAPPPASLRLGKVKRNKRKGTATLIAHVSGPGSLVLSGKRAKRAKRVARSAGRVKLPVRAKGKGRKQLNRKRKARVRVEVVFAPASGAAHVRRHRLVVLVKRHRARRAARAHHRRLRPAAG